MTFFVCLLSKSQKLRWLSLVTLKFLLISGANGPMYSFSPGRHESNVVDLNAINMAHRVVAPHQYLNYVDCQRSSPFGESTADTTATGTTSGLGSMGLNSSDRARSLNSGSSFGETNFVTDC